MTLVGSGGCGKTRLSIESAAGLLDRFEDGIWFSELASLTDGEYVPIKVAAAMRANLPKDVPPVEGLVRAIGDSNILIVLDNCEHVVKPCAELAHAILSTCPHVFILATSRHLLDVPGETMLRVPSLHTVDPRNFDKLSEVLAGDATRLFADRARYQDPDFQIGESNAEALCKICARLDGIPLAIELAAAQLRSMSVEEIDGALNDCFRVLKSGNRAALPRQRTLRAAIEWSIKLLSEDERRLLGRLSIFSGGFSLEAVEAICADSATSTLPDLLHLSDQSLVASESSSKRSRRRLLETVRQYARTELLERSGDLVEISTRHRDYFAEIASKARPEKHEDPGGWLAKLEADTDNFRQAILFSLSQPEDLNIARQLCVDLGWFWYQQGHMEEGTDLLARTLEQGTTTPPDATLLDAIYGYGWLLNSADRRDEAETWFKRLATLSVEIADQGHLADALNGLGLVHYYRDYDVARNYLEEALNINRELPGGGKSASNLNNLCFLALAACDHERARMYGEQAVTLAVQKGRHDNESVALFLLAVNSYACEEYAAARDYFKRSETIQRKHGPRQRLLHTLVMQGEFYVDSGEYLVALDLFREAQKLCRALDAAAMEHQIAGGLGIANVLWGRVAEGRPFLERSLELCQSVEDLRHVSRVLESAAALLSIEGKLEDAAHILGAAWQLRVKDQGQISPNGASAVRKRQAPIRLSLGDEAFDRLHADGGSMNIHRALARALGALRD